MTLSTTQQHMLLDFLVAISTGGLLYASDYLLGNQTFDWRALGASLIVGAVLAARQYVKAQLPTKEPTLNA